LRGSALPSAINYANAFEACFALRKIKKLRGKFDAIFAAPHVVAKTASFVAKRRASPPVLFEQAPGPPADAPLAGPSFCPHRNEGAERREAQPTPRS
jgi:hypothetical protein